MWEARRRLRFLADETGAALLEFALVAWFFFITVFGVIEFSLYFWQFDAITKGAQAALRYAVVTEPVSGDWSPSLPPPTTLITCRSTGTGTANCTPSSHSANGAAMDCIILRVQAFAPFVDPANVVVEYEPNSLGIGSMKAPTVRVRFENLQFMTIFLGFMEGRMLPNLNNTMTAEDMSSSSPGTSTSSTDCGLIS